MSFKPFIRKNGIARPAAPTDEIAGIGSLDALTTTEKLSVVGAINELNADNVDFLQAFIDARDSVE